MANAVVLLSGGIDSAATAAVAVERGFVLYAITFDYGQRHALEVASAERIAVTLNVKRHVIQTIDLRAFGASALTDDIDVPMNRKFDQLADEIPVTYVPARNTIFLAHALALAETVAAYDIFIGANAIDYSGYPDCRPEFIHKFQELANLATSAAVQGKGRFVIHAPLIRMTKADIIREAMRLDIDLSATHSCYAPSPEGLACGRCDSCLLRIKGFQEAQVTDPTRYANHGD